MPPLTQPHWSKFTEFVKQETATGGPDPFLDMLVYLSRSHSDRDKVWLAGCYGSHHCASSGYVIFRVWPFNSVLSKPDKFKQWLADNWSYLPIRPEMRSHRMLEKRHKCLWDFAHYSAMWQPKLEPFTYDTLWNHSVAKVKYYARYMAIKYLELLRRMGLHSFQQPDLRAQGAWSPRRTLAMLWPSHRILADKENNTKAALDAVEHAATMTVDKLAANGIYVNLFQLQVLLCEYRESLNGSYYPGKSIDEDLEYMRVAEKRWPILIKEIYRARKKLFKPETLGELSGWNGPRKNKATFKLAGRF